jgi:hypothetical protein
VGTSSSRGGASTFGAADDDDDEDEDDDDGDDGPTGIEPVLAVAGRGARVVRGDGAAEAGGDKMSPSAVTRGERRAADGVVDSWWGRSPICGIRRSD